MRTLSTPMLGRSSLALAVVLSGSAAASAQSAPELSLVARFASAEVISVVRSAAGYIYYSTGAELRGMPPNGAASFRVDSGAIADLAISAQGDRLAFSRGETSMSVWTIRLDPRTGKPVGHARRLSVSSGRAAAFSRDGRFVAFSVIPPSDTAAPRIVRVPVGAGPELVVAREAGWAQSLRWSRDGKGIYYRHGAPTPGGPVRRTLRRVPADGGTSTVLAPIGDLVGVSPDGRSVAYLAAETPPRIPRKTVVISNARGEELRRFALPRGVSPLDWGQDINQILALRSRPQSGIRFVDFAGQIKDLTPMTGADEWPMLSPNGKQLAVRTLGEDRDHLTVIDLESGRRRVLKASNQPDLRPALWSPDGTQVAFFTANGRSLSAIDLVTNAEREIARCDERIGGGMWIRPARLLYFCRRDSAIELRAASLEGASVPVRTIPVSPGARFETALAGDSTIVLLSDTRVVAFPRSTDQPRTLYTAPPGETLSAITVAPGAEWIAFLANRAPGANGQGQEVVRIVPVGAGTARSLPLPPIRMLGGVTWDPERRHIAVLAEHEGSRVDAWLIPLDGAPAFALTGLDPYGIVGGASFADDGSGLLYTASGRTEYSLWTVDISRKAGRPTQVP